MKKLASFAATAVAALLMGAPVAQAASPVDVIARALMAREVSAPAYGILTSGFGPRWGAMHTGIDIAGDFRSPIMAVRSAQVIEAGPASGYGQWVVLQHDDGAKSIYGHVEDLYVVPGQYVRAGETIASMGNRGFSTGTHLHFEYWPNGRSPIDPWPWLVERGVSILGPR